VILADTSFFYALLAPHDQDHDRAVAALREIGPARSAEVLLTTNYVIAETLTLSRREGHRAAVRLGEALWGERITRIHRATNEDETEAFAYFKRYADQDYSFVDCVSFTVMLKLGITEALTFDAHFSHRFIVRPGPRQNR
jgi:predicted nucleic acid-binding protein